MGLLIGLVMIYRDLLLKVSIGAVSYVDARCLRRCSHCRSRRFLQQRQKLQLWHSLRGLCMTRLGQLSMIVQQVVQPHCIAVHVSWGICCHWSNEHKAFDGLLFNRAYGVCAYGLATVYIPRH